MYNEVHVDKKWFQQTKDGVAYLCVPDEEPPHRTCQSKRHIRKIMFLCAFRGTQAFTLNRRE